MKEHAPLLGFYALVAIAVIGMTIGVVVTSKIISSDECLRVCDHRVRAFNMKAQTCECLP